MLSNISVLPIKMHIIFNLVYGSQSSELLCYPGIEIACCLRMVLGLVLWKREVIIVVDFKMVLSCLIAYHVRHTRSTLTEAGNLL